MPVSQVQSNPFCTRFVRPGEIPYQFAADFTWQQDYNRCNQIIHELDSHRLGLIVGPHGTGKSTLIETLRPRLSQRFDPVVMIKLVAPEDSRLRERMRVARENARIVRNEQTRLRKLPQAIDRNPLLIVDGLEQLSRPQRWRLTEPKRERLAVLATSHVDMRRVPVLHRTATLPRVVDQLTNALLSESPPELKSLIQNELDRRQLTTVSNVRELWFDLYDLVAQQSQSH